MLLAMLVSSVPGQDEEVIPIESPSDAPSSDSNDVEKVEDNEASTLSENPPVEEPQVPLEPLQPEESGAVPIKNSQEGPQYGNLNFGMMHEMGQIFDGNYNGNIEDRVWVDRMGGWFARSATINENWFIAIGIGGAFQFPLPLPVKDGATWPNLNTKFFFWGPAALEVAYTFGDAKEGKLKLGAGSYNYKYTKDPKNLGEYLFRSEAYPTTLFSNGYNLTGTTSAPIQGAKLDYNMGDIKLNAFLLTETVFAPLYDISLAFIADYNPGGGFLTIGAGVNFKRLIPIRPDRTTVESTQNAYFTYQNEIYTSNKNQYAGAKGFYLTALSSATNTADSTMYQALFDYYEGADKFIGELTFYESIRDDPASLAIKDASYQDEIDDILVPQSRKDTIADIKNGVQYEYFSRSATHLDFYFSLDLGSFLDLEKGQFTLFGEVALLGIKDYPIIYTDKSERMPLSIGLNIPTFGVLDLFSIQGEYLKNPYINSIQGPPSSEGGAMPYFPGGTDEAYSDRHYNDATLHDNVKWSILVQKSFTSQFHLDMQAGNDHARIVGQDLFYGDGLIYTDVLIKPSSWYWSLKLHLGV